MHSAGAPGIERSLGLTHAAATFVLFVVPGLAQLVLDPVVFLIGDRVDRSWMVRGGLAVMAAAFAVAAAAPGPVTLAAALSVWGVANGAAIGFAEATLIDSWPERAARTAARLTLLSTVGDFAAPVVLGALAELGGDGYWRTGFVVVGAALAAAAVAVSLRRFPAPAAAASDDEPTLWQAVRDALGDRVLIGWLFGMALCNLLDEILVVFAQIHVRDDLAGSTAWQSGTLTAFVAGGAVGLVVLDRLSAPPSGAARPGKAGAFDRLLVRHSERRLLIATGTVCAVVFTAWLAAPTLWLSAALMALVGATTAPLYPLATAAAYARRPGRAAVIMVAGHLFAPFTLVLPWLIGLLADHAGVRVALAVLVAQPLGLVVLAAVTRARATTADRDSRDSQTGDAR